MILPLISLLWSFAFPSPVEIMMAQVGDVRPDLASAIERATEDPRERSLLVAIARHEAGPSFAQDTIGDNGRSVGPYQRLNGPKSFLWDAEGSTLEALRQLRESWQGCRRWPVLERLAIYARGKCNERGRELSRSRVRMAMAIGGWR